MRIVIRSIALGMLVLMGVGAGAQNLSVPTGNSPIQLFPSLKINWSEAITPAVVLNQGLHLLQGNFNASDFQLSTERESPEGFYYLFSYQKEGAPFLDRYVKFFVDRHQVIRQVIYCTAQLDMPRSGSFADFSKLKTSLVGNSHIGEMNKVWVWNSPVWQAAVEVVVVEDIAAYAEKRYFDADLNELYRQDFAWRFKGKDSTVHGMVFNPDPLTTAQVPYGGAYQDFNDGDSTALNNERFSLPIRVDFVNDSFILRDSVFHFNEIENPKSDEPKGLTPAFDFTRAQDEFEFVNSFYHLQTWVRRVHDLGYNLPNTTIQVDPHASNGGDVSWFSPAYGELALGYGDGGIDDGEDADVVVHELGHALSYTASPATTNGLERTSMEEGTCDYFAMSYSRQLSNYGWQKTFSWDGNVTWQGRVSNTGKSFPGDFSNNKYNNAEVWVAALTEVYDSLGPDRTDRLVLCALYNQVSNMTFVQMAANCLQCDSIQNAGANSSIIYHAMNRRGMAHPMGFKVQATSNWKLLNTQGFAFQGESMVLDFAGTIQSGKVEIYDLQGKLIRSEVFQSTAALEIGAGDIKKGLYLLRVNSDTNLSYSVLIARH